VTSAPAPKDPLGAPDPSVFIPTVPGQRSLTRRVLRPMLRAWLRLEVEGLEHVPKTGPVLVASSHRSHADSVAIASAVTRPVHFLGDLKLTSSPVVGPQLPKLGMVPLRRGEADDNALGVIRELLRQDGCVAVYPEGSRSRDGRVHRLRSGVARIAAEMRVPIVPAAAVGIGEVWPVDSNPRPLGGKVIVRFAPAMAPPEDTPRSRRTFNMELQTILADLAGVEMATTFSEAHGGNDPGAPASKRS
jgi:1-acyl-sn-glycerol-3-phosphate acyltransferase